MSPRWLVKPDRVTLRVGVVAVAVAVLTYLASWGLLSFVCLFNAAIGFNILPSPNSWTLRAVYSAVAILVGLLTFRACREWELALPGQVTVPAGLALAAVLVVSGSMYAVGVSHEHHYLKHLPPGMSQEAGLVDGHRACDWLAAQPWGEPTYPDRTQDIPARRLAYLIHAWRYGKWHWANSTERLMVYYIDHLDAQQPGPLTQNERQQVSVVGSAWFELCPFQQWVHRPVGGSDS